MARKLTKKGNKKQLDKLWSNLVKDRALWRCERCLKLGISLNSHHIISRRYLNLRWNLDNGLCTCVGCHYWMHQNPVEGSVWLLNLRGEKWHERLLELKKSLKKPIVDEIRGILEEEAKERKLNDKT